MWRGGVVLGRRTCNREVAGSSPGRSAPRNNSGQVVHNFTHTHVPLFTKQYKLVPAQAGTKQALHATHWPWVRDLQLRLVSGWGLQKRRSVPLCGPLWLGKDFSFRFSVTFKQLVFSVQLFKRTSYLQRVQSKKVGERYRRRSVYGSLLGVWRSTLQTVRRTHLYLSGDDYRQDLPQAALPVLFLLTGQFLRFSPRRGDTLNRSNLTLIGSGVGFYGPKNWKKIRILPI